jgi:outer membrane protein, adhesin transport system
VAHAFKAACCGALVLASASVLAQTTPLPAPLLEATRAALAGNPDVQERWKAFRATALEEPAARAAWRPQVDLQASVGRQSRSPSAVSGTFPTNGVTLSLNQLLFDGGVASSAIREAAQERVLAFHDLMAASEQVSLNVVRAYLDVLRTRDLVQIATDNYVEHKRTVDLMNERVSATVGRRSDLEQATGRLALAESALAEESIALHNASTRYLRAVGALPPDRLPGWPENRALAPLPASAAEALNLGLPRNPTLLAALGNLRSRDEAAAGRQAVFMPRLEGRLELSQSKNDNGTLGRYRDEVAEILLRQNLYRGGADAARRAQFDALALRARAQLDQTCREVRQSLTVAHKDVSTLNQQLALQDTQRLAVDRTREGFRQQFDIGQRSLLDLLDTQAEFFATERTWLNTRYDQLIAQARTLAAMGQLVATLGGQNPALPLASDEVPEGYAGDVLALCPPEPTFLDSLERIKAGLQFPERPKAPVQAAFVVLLPNADGSVGSVAVQGAGGSQSLTQALQAANASGASAPYTVTPEELQRTFGAALGAQPPLPQRTSLLFQSGATRLTPDSEAQWPRLLDQLKARQTLDITVAGHADTVGSDRLNERLALQRADTIVRRLRASGFQDVEVTVEGYGSRQLAVPTGDETPEPRNRRVVITVR